MDRKEVVERFRFHKHDRESIGVEIGLLSMKIFSLEEKIRSNINDTPTFFAYRLDLIEKLRSRRKLLDLLKKTNTPLHHQIIEKIENLERSFYPERNNTN